MLCYFCTRYIMPMSVIILLLVASISVASLFLFAFIWSVKDGQYDDEIAPAVRILFDDISAGSKPDRELLPEETVK